MFEHLGRFHPIIPISFSALKQVGQGDTTGGGGGGGTWRCGKPWEHHGNMVSLDHVCSRHMMMHRNAQVFFGE